MSSRLDGRIALVTGGANGIGEAIVSRLASEGSRVFIADIDEDGGPRLVERLAREGHAAAYVQLDVSKEEDWRRIRNVIRQESPQLDILVNNAGVGDFSGIDTFELPHFEKTVAICMTGVACGLAAMVDLLKNSQHASVINIASVYAVRGGMGTGVAYHAAKGGVRAMTLNAAVHWAPSGIRVNAVHPGFIETDLLASVRGTPLETQLLQQVPMARLGLPHEVAAAVAFLAGDDASFITGSEIIVDGGLMAR